MIRNENITQDIHMKKSKVKSQKLKLPPLIVILGPTASGKSELAIKLAKKFCGEIVGADSRQIYRGTDIGTGKIPKADVQCPISMAKEIKKLCYGQIDSIPHYMIDIINPDQEFTVAKFKEKTLKVISDILRRDKIPFLVGGTGLYIQAIVDNLEIPKVPPNLKLRKKLEKLLKNKGINYLWRKLIKIDPKAKYFVQKNNPRRIIRALEICINTGKPFSQLRKKGKPLFNVLQIGIKVPRKKLYQRIDKRVDTMMKQGLVEETKRLARKYSFDLPSMSGIGYKEIGECLSRKQENKKTRKQCLKEAVQKIKYRTHQYARRQETWFKKDKRIKWVKNERQAEKLVKRFGVADFSLRQGRKLKLAIPDYI